MKKIKHILLGAVIVLTSSFIAVQATYTLSEESTLNVTGTSTLHEWLIDLEEMNCVADISIDGDSASISNLSFEAVSESFQSEHGRMMNNKTYDALKSDDYPTVKFSLKNTFNTTINGSTFSGLLTGYLSLAGETKEIQVPISGSINGNFVTLKGEKSLVMSEYGIKPPTALLGTITTGDQVTVHYNLNLKTIN